MMQQMFIENNEVDMSADLSALLTFAIDDISDFSSRSTTFSKTIVLPGTNRNNITFGNIFDIGQGNQYDPALPNYGYNYNASKSATCIIFQDNIQAFKGVIRITQINKYGEYVDYETVVFGDLFLLNTQLSSGLLEDLDFSAYNHQYTFANAKASWDAPMGSGYFYPLIDYGTYSTDKHNWQLKTFRPAFYVKEYIDKMFTAAGFKYTSALFDSARFKSLIVPNNTKTLNKLDTALFESYLLTGSSTVLDQMGGIGPIAFFKWQGFTSTNFTSSDSNSKFTYTGTASLSGTLYFTIEGTQHADTSDFILTMQKNGVNIPGISKTVLGTSSTGSYVWGNDVPLTLNPGDYIQWRYQATRPGDLSYFINVTYATANMDSDVAIVQPVSRLDTIDCNYSLPKNIRQIDFLVSIVKLFNLYVYEDKFDNRLIHITPFVDFFDTTTVIDWTYKMNRDKVLKVKPMSELNAKIYKYNYKVDSDYYNDLYNKRYGQGYGSYIFDTLYEFASQEDKLEIIFSSTPLVGYVGQDKVYSTIFKRSGTDAAPVEEKTDSIIRILQAKKITGVSSYTVSDEGLLLDTVTSYGYAGHLDDPDAPTADLDFGALEELFFILVGGNLSNTQFNVYWSSYMAEITDKDSKLLTANFRLLTTDIYNLDFSKYITVDGVLFRLNKITDYNMSEPMDCEVELLKVNYTIY